MRRLRPLLHILWVLPALLIAIVGVAWVMVATETGSTWVLHQASDLALEQGVEFKFKRSHGSLLGQLEIEGLSVLVDGNRVDANTLVLQWRPQALLNKRLHFERIELREVRLLPAPSADQPATAAELPDLVLPVAIALDHFTLSGFTIEQKDSITKVKQITLAARLDQNGIALSELDFQGDGMQFKGSLDMTATAPHRLSGSLAARIEESLTGKEIGTVVADAVLGGTALQPDIELTINTPTTLKLRGSMQLNALPPSADMVLEWPELRWPLHGPVTVEAQTGRVHLQGNSEDYRLELSTGLKGDGLPNGAIELIAQGNLQGINLQPLTIKTLNGELQARGTMDWLKVARWDLDVVAAGINPGLYLSEWPGDISGRVKLKGRLQDANNIVLDAGILGLTGHLREQAVSAKGELGYGDGRFYSRALELASGPNRISLDGQIDVQRDGRFKLDFTIKAPKLAAMHPGLGGQLEGVGRLNGTRLAPIVVAKLKGHALSYQAFRAEELLLDVDWQANGGKGQLRLAGVVAEAVQASEVTADLSGTPESHRLNLAANTDDFSVQLGAEGGLLEQTWQGQLERLNLTEKNLGPWRLQAPTKLRVSAESIRAESLCLSQDATLLCAKGDWKNTGGINFNGTLSGLDLARFNAQLPGEGKLQGLLNGAFRLGGTVEKPIASVELHPSDGLILMEGDERPFQLAYRNAKISGRFENDRGSADLRFELGQQGKAQGSVALGADHNGTRSLAGEVNADFPDLGLVAGFAPALEQVQGRLHLKSILGGTLATPRLTGVLEITDASAVVPAAGIELRDMGLSVRGDGAAPLQIKGQVRSGGLLSVAGTVDLAAAAGPYVELNLSGEDFQVVHIPEASVLISPELQLRGKPPFHLSGRLKIPQAELELIDLPSGTVAVSADEEIIGETIQKPPPRATNLTAAVRIELGDKVNFKGFGLKTGLSGALDAKVDNKGNRVDGKIDLENGHYKAYGQDLTIERGRLVFAGSPSNPNVDLRAMRLSNDRKVKAFLTMNGPIAKPRPRIYSEPTLPESEALAYLVTGNAGSKADGQQGAEIVGAALSLGLSKGEPLLQDLSNQFGLDELRIQGGDSGLQDSSLILGKYLNPDLYVGYSQGLFNPEGAVMLRLKLSEKLEVESRSGTKQSVDLFYRIEHD